MNKINSPLIPSTKFTEITDPEKADMHYLEIMSFIKENFDEACSHVTNIYIQSGLTEEERQRRESFFKSAENLLRP